MLFDDFTLYHAVTGYVDHFEVDLQLQRRKLFLRLNNSKFKNRDTFTLFLIRVLGQIGMKMIYSSVQALLTYL